MGKLFITVLNMSLTASYVILLVAIIRMLLRKAPKSLSYALWGVVAFRLIIPFSFDSIYSLMPRNMNSAPLSYGTIYQQSPQIQSGISSADTSSSSVLSVPAIEAKGNLFQAFVKTGTYIWVIGTIALLAYSIVSIVRIKSQLKGARLIEENIFEADNLKTPFLLGIMKPRIYLPLGLNDKERSYILIHEQTHIRRKDHIIKTLAYVILSIHWFNPLVWIAFMLMSMDMELSCDEKVLKEVNEDVKKPYANLLLSLAAPRHIINGNPLAFGEGNVGRRIKNVLNYKKPGFWVIAVSIVIVAAAGIGLMANPKAAAITPSRPEVALDQPVGVDMAELDYASDDMVIFHDYFGLFVYDLNSRQIIRSVDLKPIGCHQTQGDNYCEVIVSMDGDTVQLHPLSSDNMFVYTVSRNRLQDTSYKPMRDPFRSRFVPIDEVIHSTQLGYYCHQAVSFGTGEYGYIYTEDGTIGTLVYKQGDREFRLFDE